MPDENASPKVFRGFNSAEGGSSVQGLPRYRAVQWKDWGMSDETRTIAVNLSPRAAALDGALDVDVSLGPRARKERFR